MFRVGVGVTVTGTAVVGKAVTGKAVTGEAVVEMSVIGGNPLGSLFKNEMLSAQPEIYKLKTRNPRRCCFPVCRKD
jgi:hypothetical protein